MGWAEVEERTHTHTGRRTQAQAHTCRWDNGSGIEIRLEQAQP